MVWFGRMTLVAAIGSLVVACGDAETEEPIPELQEVEQALDADSIRLGQPTAAVDPEAEGELVMVTVTTQGLTLARNTAPVGQVTVRATNQQADACALLIRSPAGGRWQSAPIARGGSTAVSMVLSQSPYYITCERPNEGGPVAADTARLVVR